MAMWKGRIFVGDLHEAFQQGRMQIRQVADALVERLKNTRYAKHTDLVPIYDLFAEVETVDGYDVALQELYDFADQGHRLWIDSTSRRDP